jgi:hypothetical protein
MDNQEKDFLDDVDTEIDTSFRKPKKQLSEQKLQHLQNIRVKALEKKKEMKVITEKANKLKEYESLKEVKKIQKEQLAKKYDEMIENSKPKVDEDKPKDQPHSGDMPSGREVKPKVEEKPKVEDKPIKKKKIIKKIVYQEASSSDSDDADEVEVVKVKKQSKNKIIHVDKPQSQNTNYSYSNLLYESSVDKLKNRMNEERAKHLIMSVMPNYG